MWGKEQDVQRGRHALNWRPILRPKIYAQFHQFRFQIRRHRWHTIKTKCLNLTATLFPSSSFSADRTLYPETRAGQQDRQTLIRYSRSQTTRHTHSNVPCPLNQFEFPASEMLDYCCQIQFLKNYVASVSLSGYWLSVSTISPSTSVRPSKPPYKMVVLVLRIVHICSSLLIGKRGEKSIFSRRTVPISITWYISSVK